MNFPRNPVLLITWLVLASGQALALQDDRQQPLEVNADATDGTLGDGITILRGHVDIQQGSLQVRADEAEVEKVDGRVRLVTLRGNPAFLQQEIEDQGLVQAEAKVITYQVAPGIVTLDGAADVKHPQYEISGDNLVYDLNEQHFKGSSSEAGDGRIRIRLDPELGEALKDKDEDKDEDKPADGNSDG